MVTTAEKNRVSTPLKQVFRASHEARDAKKRLDLRDQSGERVIAGRRGGARSAISEHLLRREVSADLEILMNTVSLSSSFDLTGFDYVRGSILNYGLPDITHRSIDEAGVGDITAEIRTALQTYEPRLLKASIVVKRDASVDAADLKIRFLIHADLLCDPLAVPVEFVADVQVDTGDISISRL